MTDQAKRPGDELDGRSKRRKCAHRVFPYDPYHFRWECPDTKVSWETNDRCCSECVCYVCNVGMSTCRIRSHRWAGPPEVCRWTEKRGVPPTVAVEEPPPAELTIAGDAVKVASVVLPINDLGSTFDTFGVPSAMVRAYMKTPCVDAIWPLLRDGDLRSQSHIANVMDVFEAIDQACIGAKTDRTLVSKMARVTEIPINPRRNSLAILRLERVGRTTKLALHADLYITRSSKCAKSGQILKMSESTPLIEPAIDATVFPSILNDRECFEHQRVSLGHMLHIEEHGLTHRLWKAAFNDDLVCLMNARLGSTHLLHRPFQDHELPDRDCTGGLLCNERGTGKTLVACGLIASRRAPEAWLAQLTGLEINDGVRVAANIDSDDEDSDVEETRPWRRIRPTHQSIESLDSFETQIQRNNALPCPRVKTTLVVLPSPNLIAQWKQELESLGLTVGVRHGAKNFASIDELGKLDAVITTALTLSKNYEGSVLSRVRFWRVVVDELHKVLASPKLSVQGKTVMLLRAKHRWGITATPDLRSTMFRTYLRFLYGIPDMAAAALNHVHHYMRYPSSYRHSPGWFPEFHKAITVKQRADLVRPPVHHHTVTVTPGPEWMSRYTAVYTQCRENVRHLTGLTEQRIINQLLMAVGGAKAMPMPAPIHRDVLEDAVASDVQVPPDIVDCSICLQDLSQPVATQCNHFFCEACLAIWRRTQPYPRCPICRGDIDPGTIRKCAQPEPDDYSAANPETDLPPCTRKIEKIVEEAQRLLGVDPEARFLIFSRFPAVRHAIRDAMKTDVTNTESIKRFQTDPGIAALILSPTSCAVGLNLTQANHVFLCEPAFKVAVEKQAYARADRIGQQREVHVHRFQVDGTIEVNIRRERTRGSARTVASYAFAQ